MIAADLPKNEEARLQALYQYQILDTDFEKEFDDLVKLASYICNTPISLISLVSEDRQWFKAKVGLEVRETARELAFCAHAIQEDELMVVENASEDERFYDNPLVTEDPDIRFYAGMPLTTPDGFNLGTLCVIDSKPRHLNEDQKEALQILASQVIAQLELKVKLRALDIERKDVKRKNKSIMDSLYYAEQIQAAVLPEKEVLKTNFKEAFVLNKPRDIIGGDFYWFSEVNAIKVLVLADCTGHGVPGALMSMLGNALLRSIVDKRKTTDPDKILDKLHKELIRVLHQKQNNNKDGMDMSVFCIDERNKRISFAGANQKIIYAVGGKTHLISGDRQGLGGSSTFINSSFTAYEIDLSSKQEAIFYAFSDGICDQFGGMKGTKFLRSRLQALIEKIHHLPLDEQENIIDTTITDWIQDGQESQTDDILLIGFKPNILAEKHK